jgi:hypothetical protein
MHHPPTKVSVIAPLRAAEDVRPDAHDSEEDAPSVPRIVAECTPSASSVSSYPQKPCQAHFQTSGLRCLSLFYGNETAHNVQYISATPIPMTVIHGLVQSRSYNMNTLTRC